MSDNFNMWQNLQERYRAESKRFRVSSENEIWDEARKLCYSERIQDRAKNEVVDSERLCPKKAILGLLVKCSGMAMTDIWKGY